MTQRRDPEALLSAYLAVGMEVLPDRVVASVMGEVHRTRQRVVVGPGRTRFVSRTTFAAAAVVAMLALGAALFVVGGGPRPKQNALPDASAGPSQPAVVTSTPAPTAETLSLDLTWTEVHLDAGVKQVAWLGDRFVMVDDAGSVSTSTDGASWDVLEPGEPDPGYAELLKGKIVTWEDEIVGWWNPQDGPDYTNKPPVTDRDILRIVQPPAQPRVTTPFEGRIQSIGIGPAGIVARTNFWPDEGTREDAVWLSADGIDWNEIPFLLFEAVGVSDGFIAVGETPEEGCALPDGCSSIWHSPDGLAWRNLGDPHAGLQSDADTYVYPLVPWMGGALATDGVGRFGLWTSQGYTELPMGADLPPAPTEVDPTFRPFATGPLGLVSIRRDGGMGSLVMDSLVTRDGVDWKIQPLPSAMATSTDHPGPTIAVGDLSVLYLTWSGHRGSAEVYVPSLWVGSVEP